MDKIATSPLSTCLLGLAFSWPLHNPIIRLYVYTRPSTIRILASIFTRVSRLFQKRPHRLIHPARGRSASTLPTENNQVAGVSKPLDAQSLDWDAEHSPSLAIGSWTVETFLPLDYLENGTSCCILSFWNDVSTENQ
jgi:hypothetical protein